MPRRGSNNLSAEHQACEPGQHDADNRSQKITTEPRDVYVSYLNQGQDDQMEIHGYRPYVAFQILTWTGIIFTAGVLRLVFHWFDEWYLKCTHLKCPIRKAPVVLVVEYYQKKHRHVYVREVDSFTSDDIKIHTVQSVESSDRTLHEKTLKYPSPDGSFVDTDSVRIFTCKKIRYIWDPNIQDFVKLKGWGSGLPTSSFHRKDPADGLSAYEQARRRIVYGSNSIHIRVKSFFELLVREALSPFYIFQVFSVTIWFLIEYYIFASAIVAMSMASIISAVVQTRKNRRKLRSTVQDKDVVTVNRGSGKYETVSTEDLVPGDLIVIPSSGCMMYCDAVLLSGTCVVNESMLTGESVPVTKTPLLQRSDILYNTQEHGRHTLFCGTKIVQTLSTNNEKVIAVVTCTGFMTSKGSLVSAILYPPPVDFRFERDSYKFIAFLALLAVAGLVYNIYERLAHGETGIEIFLHSFDLITICVPPALPAAMTAGIILAQKRLKKRKIYCISPRTINVAGTINCMCFDKTGTLTEDGLDMWGIIPTSQGGQFLSPLKSPPEISELPEVPGNPGLPLLLMGMSTCHSLNTINGELSGDPLDLKMFESTGSKVSQSPRENSDRWNHIQSIITWKSIDIGIIRQFPFSSSLQRMGVLCRILDNCDLQYFCKGSPEIVRSLSLPETVPQNFDQVLEQYASKGYRVIALAHRSVDLSALDKLHKLQREELEIQLQFLGFVILENRLKSDTSAVIQQLTTAKIRTIMVTGDNLLTAISVAKDCGMIKSSDRLMIVDCKEIDSCTKPLLHYKLSNTSSHQLPETMALDIEYSNCHFALTGKSWSLIREHYPEIMNRIVVKGTVFARMSPDQKQQLVEELQQLGYCVGMCGDGANDCGALKAAFAGISLSETEASVASPFTSKEPSISCVLELIRQGRCALVTSFGIFKFMAAYSITQFISVMILYGLGSNLTDFEFLYIDVFIICALCFFFGNNDPHPGPLFHKPPLTSLLSPPPIGSLIIQVSLVAIFQGLSLVLLSNQEWFTPFGDQKNTTGFLTGDIACHENYSVFSVSLFQYIGLAVAFAKGKPYRTAIYRNKLFLSITIIITALSVWILLEPPSFVRVWLNLLVPEHFSFRLMLLGLSAAEFVAILLAEFLLVERLLYKLMDSTLWKTVRPFKEKYVAVLQELEDQPLSPTK